MALGEAADWMDRQRALWERAFDAVVLPVLHIDVRRYISLTVGAGYGRGTEAANGAPIG